MQVLSLAMIGCGRAAQSLHLPAAALCSKTETKVLIDVVPERARELANAYGVPAVRSSVAAAADTADAAVVALPHHLHAQVTRQLLEAGLHVLVEKPLALTAHECDELAALARERGLTLAVGMIRRYFPAARFVERALEREILGPVERIEVEEGAPFNWEVASDFTFRPETGGGVLADTGIHLFDLLSWWFGDLRVKVCRDDACGGVEAEAEVEILLPSGAPVRVELSRTRSLDNEVVITGSRGTLRAGTGFGGRVSLDLGGDPLVGGVGPVGQELQNVRQLFARQMEDFADAVLLGREPAVGASEATGAVRLLEQCRALREPLELPWRSFRPPGGGLDGELDAGFDSGLEGGEEAAA